MRHPDAIDASIYYRPIRSATKAFDTLKAGLLRAGAFCDGTLEAPGLEDEIARSDESLIRDGFPLSHQAIETKHGLTLWGPGVRYRDDMIASCGILTLHSVLWVPGREGADLSWNVNGHIIRGCLEVSQPELAMMNGYCGAASLPRGKEIGERHALPSFFTPWVFIGKSRLTRERRAQLEALPAHRVEALAGGLVIQAVPDLFTDPTPRFVAALRKIPNPTRIAYRQARPRLDWLSIRD